MTNPTEERRERIARIIDPDAWAGWDKASGVDTHRIEYRLRPSLAKADAILSDDQSHVLRGAFRNADDSDWQYLLGLLQASVRHRNDAQTGFWISVLGTVREALARGENHG